jgi:hypothetical protein
VVRSFRDPRTRVSEKPAHTNESAAGFLQPLRFASTSRFAFEFIGVHRPLHPLQLGTAKGTHAIPQNSHSSQASHTLRPAHLSHSRSHGLDLHCRVGPLNRMSGVAHKLMSGSRLQWLTDSAHGRNASFLIKSGSNQRICMHCMYCNSNCTKELCRFDVSRFCQASNCHVSL